MILILGSERDAHAVHVRAALGKAGHEAQLLDTSTFPANASISFDPTSDHGSIALAGSSAIPFAAVSAVYWRMYDGIGASDLPNTKQAEIAENDARGLVETLFLRLQANWVNDWFAFLSHRTKPAQLATVAALGVPIPPTLVTNCAHDVRAFAARYPDAIFKPVQGGAHTRRLTADHLSDDALRRLAFAPVTLQAFASGANIRVFVAGDRVLACTVDTDAIDFRDDPDPRIVPHELPVEVAAMCKRAARALHLVWTGIDLRLSLDGRYTFLEANPSPMFMGFEEASGLPITAALVALLTATRR